MPEDKKLKLISLGWDSDSPHVGVLINDKKYTYKPRGFSPRETHEKIEKMSKKSSGQALQWLKSHSDLVDESRHDMTIHGEGKEYGKK